MVSVLGNPIRHIWLVRRMADVAGVDLAEEQSRGALTQEDWAAMVTRCRGCAHPGDCERHLDRGDFSAPPDWCENRAAFDALSEKVEA